MISFRKYPPVQRANMRDMHSFGVLIDNQQVGVLFNLADTDDLWEIDTPLLHLIGFEQCSVGPVWSSAERAKEDIVRVLEGRDAAAE